MSSILLHDPIPASPHLERLHLFPGRHLGEDEFDRLQAYADARLEPLLAGYPPGILHGLEVAADRVPDGIDPLHPYRLGDGCSVAPGMAVAGNGRAVGVYYPLYQHWNSLIETHLAETETSDAGGIYFLILRRAPFHIDADPDVDPCQRTELDPNRDSRRVVLGALALRRVALPSGVAAGASQEQAENAVAAYCADGEFLGDLGHAVPLGLLAVEETAEGPRPRWFSATVGRYLAQPDSGYRVLHSQVTEAFRRLVTRARRAGELSGDPEFDLLAYLEEHLLLDYLPAAGQLPLALLQDAASVTPRVAFLPSHLRIDAVAVPDTAVDELIDRHLPRRVVDLRRPAGEHLRLLLAVPERHYRPEMLDIPQTDGRLEQDVYRYFMRAHDSWLAWRRQFGRLYSVQEEAGAALTPEQLRALSLPQPVPPPAVPSTVFEAIVERARSELESPLPHPYDRALPEPPERYQQWFDDGAPPAASEPEDDGLVIQYAIGQVELEALDNRIRILQTRLNKTQDYLLLQRQQLDSQTVSLAALAGGVAGDGSGLQLARWMPYTRLNPLPLAAEAVAEAAEREQPSPPEEDATPLRSSSASREALFTTLSMTAADTTHRVAMTQPLIPTQISSLARKTISTTAQSQRFSVLKPATRSAVEFGINKARLEQMTTPARNPVAPPAFQAETPRVGVLSHIHPEFNEYKKAYDDMEALLANLDGLFDRKETRAIKRRLQRIRDRVGLEHPTQMEENLPCGDSTAELVQHRYQQLFKAGQILTQQIAIIEARFDTLERDLNARLRDRQDLQQRLVKLAAMIVQERQELDVLDGRRLERLGDYAVTQRLLDEDWRRTYLRNQERTRLLTTGLSGLYYVRVNSAGVSLPLADPLTLRHGSARDIVPGCPADAEYELPDSLAAFFDTVREVPVADWAALAPVLPRLANAVRVEQAAELRQLRLARLGQPTPNQSTRLPLQQAMSNLNRQNLAVLGTLASQEPPLRTASLSAFNRGNARVLSLQDLLTGSAGRPRYDANQLQTRLEQCIGCLVEHLERLAPSLRLEWSQLAEDDRLPLPGTGRWPGLDRAEQDDFNTVRTIVELIDWWFRQLVPDASGAGRSALRNMIRAAVIHSALGDPAGILHGEVQVPPRRLVVGEPMRLSLNKPPPPGTLLQLLDRSQQVVGLLSVADADQRGVVANLVQVDRPGIPVGSGFTVVASKLTKGLGR
ncbi:hypothetical protein [Thioalkalivibrio paradoxus]|uniref:Uncharacterized protein n=1 Tax=Thioalkalivibrio paradoxus ARh 1 TaxID=713585 RepID=W0DSQ8_9GAMM|nr:hypothetical protein [Thioalkalivibrio paradoxus]AHE99895.1 hypothetical protein THITH_03155 [Thioalkalivibrio paradoxus ARh 1]